MSQLKQCRPPPPLHFNRPHTSSVAANTGVQLNVGMTCARYVLFSFFLCLCFFALARCVFFFFLLSFLSQSKGNKKKHISSGQIPSVTFHLGKKSHNNTKWSWCVCFNRNVSCGFTKSSKEGRKEGEEEEKKKSLMCYQGVQIVEYVFQVWY